MTRYLFLVLVLLVASCKQQIDTEKTTTSTDTYSAKEHYNKKEVTITMRDGIKLHTTIYSPKDTSKKYPIVLSRTPYSCQPYGEDQYREKIGPNTTMMKDGYIVVYQDVRGRWNSEGVYDNMRAFIPNKTGNQVDEASDTYDTIEYFIQPIRLFLDIQR